MEERKRRASRAVAIGGPAPPWVRNLQVDSDPVRRRVEVSRHLALSVALPAGETWLGRRALGGESRAAAPALLYADVGRPKSASLPTEELEGFRRRHQPDRRNRTCLILKRSFKNGSLPCTWKPPQSQVLPRSSRSTSKIGTKSYGRTARRNTKRIGRPYPSWMTCIRYALSFLRREVTQCRPETSPEATSLEISREIYATAPAPCGKILSSFFLWS